MRKIYLTSVYIGSAVFVLCYSRSLGLRCDERCVCVWGWMDVHGQRGGVGRASPGSVPLIPLAASEFDLKTMLYLLPFPREGESLEALQPFPRHSRALLRTHPFFGSILWFYGVCRVPSDSCSRAGGRSGWTRPNTQNMGSKRLLLHCSRQPQPCRVRSCCS